MLKETDFYISKNNLRVQCTLCPHLCKLKVGQTGICLVRKNIEGKLFSENYGIVTALNLDPIEKKPLYHFYPGKNILSLGSFGCNLKCNFCQNHGISQNGINDFSFLNKTSSAKIIEKAIIAKNNIGIAYTYNEPVIFYEFMYETAILAKENNLKNIMVSNGYINSEPLDKIINYIDAFNIDLKAFTEDFYIKQTQSNLRFVKKTIEKIILSGKHLEITNLIIQGLNDNENDFINMINYLNEIGGDSIILHISAYFPKFKSQIPATNSKLINKLFDIAKSKLKYVYEGNVTHSSNQNTYCKFCGNKLIERNGFQTKIIGIDLNKCNKCLSKIENIIM